MAEKKVDNVKINVEFSEEQELKELKSEEGLSVLMGKLAKAVKDIISHLANGVKHISAADRENWNGKANGTHGHSAAEISGLPASLPANGGNADTVDGLHGWQLGTLNAVGQNCGTNFSLYCQHELFGDDRFGFGIVSGHEVRVHYATNAGNANTLQNTGFSDGQGSMGIVAVAADNGAIEIGPYIDFHDSGHVYSDYAVRLFADSQGVLHVGRKDGSEQGLLICDISGNAHSVDGVHITVEDNGNAGSDWFAVYRSGNEIGAINPQRAWVGNAVNPDTVDGLHGWEFGTLDPNGNSFGTNFVIRCKYDVFNDGRFAFQVQDHGIRTDYATDADMLDGLHADSFAAVSHSHAKLDNLETSFVFVISNTRTGTVDYAFSTAYSGTAYINLVCNSKVCTSIPLTVTKGTATICLPDRLSIIT